jgi:hypothetical protein|tara:strand:+ start:266 stop:454 length:189 start_codon:yes stop_codon:yes gene_type:complete
MENIKRNPNRKRKVARRTAGNWIDAMTPQGQALYCSEHVENSYNYMTVEELAETYREHLAHG